MKTPNPILSNSIQISKCNDLVFLRKAVQHLFDLLDNIDTADDIAKGNDVLYRELVRNAHKQRWDVGLGLSSNGSELMKNDFAQEYECKFIGE